MLLNAHITFTFLLHALKFHPCMFPFKKYVQQYLGYIRSGRARLNLCLKIFLSIFVGILVYGKGETGKQVI